MSIRRLALIKHQRKHNEPLTHYVVRLAVDRVSATANASTPGELLLADLIRGVNCPKLVTQLNKIAVPTVESIEACVKEFSAMEQAAKNGTTAAVVHRNQTPTSADKNIKCLRCSSTKHTLKDCTTAKSIHYVQRKSLNKNKPSNNAQPSAPSSSSSSTGDMEAMYASLDNPSSQSLTKESGGFKTKTDE